MEAELRRGLVVRPAQTNQALGGARSAKDLFGENQRAGGRGRNNGKVGRVGDEPGTAAGGHKVRVAKLRKGDNFDELES